MKNRGFVLKQGETCGRGFDSHWPQINTVRKMYVFNYPTKIIFGVGAFNLVKKIPEWYKSCSQILLVTGRKSMKKAGYVDKFIELVKPLRVEWYNKVEPNPTLQNAEEAANIAKEVNADLVVALGGGSAMDLGKAVATYCKHKGKLKDYFYKKKKFTHKGLSCICIPSTPASSSEITKYSVFTDPDAELKRSISSEFLQAELAIIDPEISLTLPNYQLACSALDILCHAIESYWSKKSNFFTKQQALSAAELVYKNAPLAYHDASLLEAKVNLHKASMFAGFAFNITGTTSVHSCSYPFTVLYGIPHGHACALFLLPMMKFFYEKAPEKVSPLLRAFDADDIEECLGLLREWIESLGLELNVEKLGVKKKDFSKILSMIVKVNKFNDPYDMMPQHYESVLESVFRGEFA